MAKTRRTSNLIRAMRAPGTSRTDQQKGPRTETDLEHQHKIQ
jgi:hypothetical protein